MTDKEKQLLLKDLCARLPFGVIVRHADYLVDSDSNYTGQFWYKRGYLYNICRLDNITTTIIESEGSDEEGYEHICDLEKSLPYLRPMSSMTDEEKGELWFLLTEGRTNIELNSNGQLTTRENIELGFNYPFVCPEGSTLYVDWLNKNHFDYRGLIPKGLAIEVTRSNNPYKKK